MVAGTMEGGVDPGVRRPVADRGIEPSKYSLGSLSPPHILISQAWPPWVVCVSVRGAAVSTKILAWPRHSPLPMRSGTREARGHGLGEGERSWVGSLSA